MAKKDRRLNILVCDESHAMLLSLAKGRGQTISEYIRQLIRDAHECREFARAHDRRPRFRAVRRG